MASSSNNSSCVFRLAPGSAPHIPRRGHVFQGARRTGPRDLTPFIYNEAGENVSASDKHFLIVSLLMMFCRFPGEEM